MSGTFGIPHIMNKPLLLEVTLIFKYIIKSINILLYILEYKVKTFIITSTFAL